MCTPAPSQNMRTTNKCAYQKHTHKPLLVLTDHKLWTNRYILVLYRLVQSNPCQSMLDLSVMTGTNGCELRRQAT